MHDFWQSILGITGAIIAWVTGETGRIFVAAGMGGAARWLASEKRRVMDGVVSVSGGMIVGVYLWPIILYLPSFMPFGIPPLPETPNNIAMAACVMGGIGISFFKISMAYLHIRLHRAKEGDDEGI